MFPNDSLIQGLEFLKSGEFLKARTYFEDLTQKTPTNPNAWHLLGVALFRSGLYQDAIQFFNKAVELDPNFAEAHYNLGVTLQSLCNFTKAIESYDLALASKPNYPEAQSNKGIALQSLGELQAALNCYNAAIALNEQYADAFFNKGTVLGMLKQFEQAVASYDSAIELNPQNALAFNNRGNALKELKLPCQAKLNYAQCIALKPDYAPAHYNLALTLKDLHQTQDAISSYNQAIALNPRYAEAHSNKGVALKDLRSLNEALDCFARAIELNPNFAEAYCNLGVALGEIGLEARALDNLDKAIATNPNYASAYWNKSLMLLRDGQFSSGLELYEWRWKCPEPNNPPRVYSQPIWDGQQSLLGKTIFIYAEQGFGDTIQFCRYATLLKRLGAYVILEVQKPLMHLLSCLQGVDLLVAPGKKLPSFDYYCPLLSLPRVFKTDLQNIPSNVPYVVAREDKINYWSTFLGAEGFKIAINWQGSLAKIDAGRSFPIHLFEEISNIPGVRLISLQKNEGSEQLKSLQNDLKVETLPDSFDSGENSFLDSAAILKCVDLVISSDTALTHLAGAMNCKTWLPLKLSPDWRWLLDRSDSPWYPNHTLFRQSKFDDWSTPFENMAMQLIQMKK